MNVSLTPELEKFVQELVKSGSYQTSSEVVRDALRLLEQRREENAAKVEWLRKEIQMGLDSLDRGEGKPLDMKKIAAEAKRRANITRKKQVG